MKTNLEWYQMLPEEYRELAIENSKRDGFLNLESKSLSLSIACGFYWEISPEGDIFWNKVFKKLEKDEKMEILP